jgi:hypothetical protein
MSATVSQPQTSSREPSVPASPIDQHASPVQTTGKKSGKATTAMVLGILGALAFFIPVAAWILGGIAVGFALAARSAIKAERCEGMARANAGLILGIIALVLGTAMFVINVALMT